MSTDKDKPTYEELLLKLKDKDLEIKNLQKELSKTNFKFFIKESPDLICIASPEGYFKEVNSSFTKVLGYTKRKLLNTPFLDFIHIEDRERTSREINILSENNPSIYFENRYINKKGEIVYLQWTSIYNAVNNLIYGIARNITNIRKTQEKLENSTKLFNESEKISKTGSWEFNLITKELIWSSELYSIYEIKKKPNQNLYQEYMSLFNKEDREILDNKVNQAIFDKKPYEMERQVVFGNKQKKWIYGTGIPVLNDNGDVIALRGIVRDITVKKQKAEAEKAIQEKEYKLKEKEIIKESNAKFRTYLENDPNGVIVVDEKGNLTEVNPAITNITGYPKEKLLKMSFNDLTPPDSVEIAINHFHTLKKKVFPIIIFSLYIKVEK